MWKWFVKKLTFINFFLLAIILIAMPNLDGAPEYSVTAPGGWLRTVAATYMLVSSIILILSDPAKRRLVQVMVWAALGAGCLFFVATSPVWPFWLFIAFAALTQSIRKATNTEYKNLIIDGSTCCVVRSDCPLEKKDNDE